MFEDSVDQLQLCLQKNLQDNEFTWLLEAVNQIVAATSSRKLYLNYSLCASKIEAKPISDFVTISEELKNYFKLQETTTLELSRIWMLKKVLLEKKELLEPIKKLIQIADKSELETFLKYLILMPNPENFKFAAVEALRTNIASVFDAISKYNPYPAQYFSDHQWNQMFLKAAFMQQDLGAIVDIDERANADLARIISDYAHERWAASRTIDPLFWRPVSKFLNESLLADVDRLFKSGDTTENKAAALICLHSNNALAIEMLEKYPELKEAVENGTVTWNSL